VSLSFGCFVAVVLALLASMPIYAALGARRDEDADSKRAQFGGGLLDFVLHWFLWLVEPATRLSLRLGLGPDFYNFAGLGFGVGAGVALALGGLEWAGWSLALSGVCDILDGRVARALGATSRYGAFIDSLLDRFIELAFFLGFAWLLRHSALGALCATLGFGGSVLVSYARAVGESLGVSCTGGLMQRGERLTLLSVACLLDRAASAYLGRPTGALLMATALLIGVTGLLTAIQRTAWISGQLRGPKAGRE
jgi:CDP-diacylglycerol--glycerol-3-phosphate 3-phosphatidyltransferase